MSGANCLNSRNQFSRVEELIRAKIRGGNNHNYGNDLRNNNEVRPFAALFFEMSKEADHLYCFSKPLKNLKLAL